MIPEVKAFFHEPTFTLTYVVHSGAGNKCVIIDSVLDYDSKSGRTSTEAADEVVIFIEETKLEVSWILETHVHADHLSAAPYLKSKLGGKICIGAHVPIVQETFKGVFNFGSEMSTNGDQFDHLLKDGEALNFGGLNVTALVTDGHTPACMSYVIGNAIFVGDTLFMPDFGTARCDFPGGDARQLYKSIRKLLSYPEDTDLYMCHDYGPGGRDFKWKTTVAQQKKNNIHINDLISEDAFVKMRNDRDAELDMPALILPSVQINMCAGYFPEPEANGVSYVKIPLNIL
ncbi:MAG: MBL fold metallo-hydrolase [Sneathiella sp.]